MEQPQFPPAAFTNVLRLHRLKLQVRLGAEVYERSQLQGVEVDVSFFFPELTGASLLDNDDYLCYGGLAKLMESRCKDNEFRLIEHLGAELFKIARGTAPADVKITLKLLKCKLPGVDAAGGASFTLTDGPAHAWVPPL